MIDSEVTSTVAAAGGQYAQAKHIIGPLMAFNVGLYPGHGLHHAGGGRRACWSATCCRRRGRRPAMPGSTRKPFIVLTIVVLAWLNYRGVLMTLNVNFVITAIAYLSIVVLFFCVAAVEAGRRAAAR